MTATVDFPKSSELRTQLLEAGQKSRELRETPADKRSETWGDELRNQGALISSLDADLKVAEALERQARAEAEEPKGPTAAGADVGKREARTVGEWIEHSDEYRAWTDEGREYGKFKFELPGEYRTLITSSTSDTPAAGVLIATRPPIPPIPRQRRLYIRDLLAQGETNLPAIPYVREVSPATNETAASAVPEGDAKPEAVMQFATVTALVRKIAAWVPATEEILADAPTLRSYIDNRLVYMVKVREEADLLYGVETGANPTIPGILSGTTTVTGVQTQSVVQSNSVDDIIRTLGTAMPKIELVDGVPDGIVMHPTNYWEAITARWGSANGDGNFDQGSPFVGPPGTIWGLPVVRTRSLTVDTAVLGDWSGGGQIFDRAGITVRTSDSHDDYFVKNKIAILAEERVAVAWYRPDFFVNVTVD